MNAFVLILLIAGLMFLQAFLVRHFALRGLQYTRKFSQRTAFEGDTAELVEVIRNDRPLFVPWLRAESRISSYVKLGRTDNLDVKGELYHKSVFTLSPFQQITRRHKVQLLKRGEYDIGNVTLTAGDLWGAEDCTLSTRSPAVIAVYPRLLPEADLPLPLSRLYGELVVKRHMMTDPFFVNGIRPYRSGDNARDVHWRATAHMGELQVKTHDYTVDTRLMVILNVQMSDGQWGDLMDYEQATIEYGISLSATLCLHVLKKGVAAGFAANMPKGQGKECTVLLPAAYPGREEELLNLFACLQVRRTLSFLTFLDDMMELQGMDILILSPYASPDMDEKIRGLRTRGNTVTLHILQGVSARAS